MRQDRPRWENREHAEWARRYQCPKCSAFAFVQPGDAIPVCRQHGVHMR